MVTARLWVHMHVGQMSVHSLVPALVASYFGFDSYPRNAGKSPKLRILNSSVLATGALQNRGDVCFPGGVKVLLLGNSAHCLMPSVESHSSGQQMLADCPLEAAPEPDRMSHISTSFHHPLFSLRPLCRPSFVLLSKG